MYTMKCRWLCAFPSHGSNLDGEGMGPIWVQLNTYFTLRLSYIYIYIYIYHNIVISPSICVSQSHLFKVFKYLNI